MRTLVLASTSPYRAALLRRLALPFHTAKPDVDESIRDGESPETLVERLSHSKACAARAAHPEAIIIGSDQVGVLDGTILNKPVTPERAREQLRAASGKELRFLTGLCVLDAATGESSIGIDTCRVRFRDLSDDEIADYVLRENPIDCAGSFKVEGLGIALFRSVSMDDPTALEGLPLIRLSAALRRFGLPVLRARPEVP